MMTIHTGNDSKALVKTLCGLANVKHADKCAIGDMMRAGASVATIAAFVSSRYTIAFVVSK